MVIYSSRKEEMGGRRKERKCTILVCSAKLVTCSCFFPMHEYRRCPLLSSRGFFLEYLLFFVALFSKAPNFRTPGPGPISQISAACSLLLLLLHPTYVIHNRSLSGPQHVAVEKKGFWLNPARWRGRLGWRSAQYAPTLAPSTRSCGEPIFAPISPSSSWSRRTELVWDWNGPNNNAATPFSPLPPFFAARLGRFIFATATVVSSLSPIPSRPFFCHMLPPLLLSSGWATSFSPCTSGPL